MVDRSEVRAKLSSGVTNALSEVESSTGLVVQFKTLEESHNVVAEYTFDTERNTPFVSLRPDWEDADVAHELLHMKLELVEGYAVLAWRRGVTEDKAIESAFAQVRNYVDDEVVHARLVEEGYALDGEVLKAQLFDFYTKVTRCLTKLRPRPKDGMAYLDSAGYGELCRSSYLVCAELIRRKYSDDLPYERMKRVNRFVEAFRTHRDPEAQKADRALKLFEKHEVNSVEGHRAILSSWAALEDLDAFVGASAYRRQQDRYILPWPST